MADLPTPLSPNPTRTIHPVDRTIRNQRYRGWPAWVWIVGWLAAWLPVMILVEAVIPREWQKPFMLVAGVPIVGTFFAVAAYLDWRPVERIKIGDELQAFPRGRFRPADLECVTFSADPDEDYSEGNSPVPFCQVAVRSRHGRKIRLIASVGDAARLRQWAVQHGVPVDDPQGLSGRLSQPEAGG